MTDNDRTPTARPFFTGEDYVPVGPAPVKQFTNDLDRAPALDRLREIVKPGTAVYLILRRVAPSGMSRNISAVVFVDGEPRHLDGLILAAGIGQRPRNNGEGVQVRGAGMDTGFHLVYTLSRALHNDGGYSLTHRWL